MFVMPAGRFVTVPLPQATTVPFGLQRHRVSVSGGNGNHIGHPAGTLVTALVPDTKTVPSFRSASALA